MTKLFTELPIGAKFFYMGSQWTKVSHECASHSGHIQHPGRTAVEIDDYDYDEDREYCTECGNPLEVAQIGLCDTCQENATYWEVTFTGIPSDDQLEHVALQIKQGFTEGSLRV